MCPHPRDAAAPRALIRWVLDHPAGVPACSSCVPRQGWQGPWCWRHCCGAAPGVAGGWCQPGSPHAWERGPMAPASALGLWGHSHVHSRGHLWQLPSARLPWGDGCWRATVTRWSCQQDVTPPPKPVRHRWAPVRSGCGSASTICSGTSSDGGSHGRPRPASSLGDNDPHPANPPTLPWHGGLRGLPPVAAVPACRCQLPRRRRLSRACSAGSAPTPRAPGSPSPGDGTAIPPRRHPRAHRAAGASAPRSFRAIPGGFGAGGGIHDTPAMPAAWRPGTAPGSPRVPRP